MWLAPKALELGLIDQLGTMEDAIEFAAALAELESYRIHYVLKPESPAVKLLRQFSITAGPSHARPFNLFAHSASRLMEGLDDLSQPQATVICTDCSLELL